MQWPSVRKTQIANVGFQDVTQTAVGMAVSGDTLFIHGSTDGGGSATNHAVVDPKDSGPVVTPDCASACGLADADEDSEISSFCDSTCLSGWSSAGPRFGGYGCGANDPSRFGKSCRMCFTNQKAALAEERRLASPEVMGPETGVHVVMCSTGNPPPARECSDECMSSTDAVRLWSSGLSQCDDRPNSMSGTAVDPPLHRISGLEKQTFSYARACFHCFPLADSCPLDCKHSTR